MRVAGLRGRGAAGQKATRSSPRRKPGSSVAWSVVVALVVSSSCTTTHKTSTGRTERETDSVIGASKLPGAHVVKRARDTQDSAQAQAAAIDTAVAE